MLLLEFCLLFVLLLSEFKPAAGAVTNASVNIPTQPPNNSETLVPTLSSFSLEQDRWPGLSAGLCTVLTLTTA